MQIHGGRGRRGAMRFVEYLQRLVHGSGRKIFFLIIDGHPLHKVCKGTKFIDTKPMKNRIRLFSLSPYCSELNSDKRAWNDLTNNARGGLSLLTRSSCTVRSEPSPSHSEIAEEHVFLR